MSAEPTDLALAPIDGGYTVKLSEDGRHRIDVLCMMWNWRLVTTPVAMPMIWDRGWCYYGHGPDGHGRERTMESAFRAAVLAAYVWDGDDGTEPPGYDKRAGQ